MSPAILLLAATLAGGPVGPPPSPEELEREMARLVNVEREARGVEPLRYQPALAAIARAHSRRMAATGRIDHDLGEETFEERIRKAVPDACRFGENIARHYSIDYALADLLGSPGHRGNLLSEEFTVLGIGIVRGDDGFLYITQNFARPCPGRRPH